MTDRRGPLRVVARPASPDAAPIDLGAWIADYVQEVMRAEYGPNLEGFRDIVAYPARIAREGDRTLVEFPHCPGCQTFAEPGEVVATVARDALAGCLETVLVSGETPPRPPEEEAGLGWDGPLWVSIPLPLARRLRERWRQGNVP